MPEHAAAGFDSEPDGTVVIVVVVEMVVVVVTVEEVAVVVVVDEMVLVTLL
jgi:hypothetical protein